MEVFVSEIDGLTKEDIKRLRLRCIHSPDHFWRAIADDPGLIDNLHLPDQQAKIRVTTTLAQIAKKQSESVTKYWVVVHALDLLVAFAIIVIALSFAFRKGPSPIIYARVAFPAFHLITTSDVLVQNDTNHYEAQRALNAVIGHYAFEGISAGATVDPSRLNSGIPLSHELDNMKLFNLKVAPSSVLTNIKPPIKISLIFSPRTKDDIGDAPTYQVYLLDSHIAQNDLSVIVAANDNDSRRLLSLLSIGQFNATVPVK